MSKPVPEHVALPRFGTGMWWQYYVADHAAVRLLVTNHYRIDEDIWRSNQPGFRRLKRLKAEGLKSVLSLRGDHRVAPVYVEKAAAAELGLRLEFARLRAHKLPRAEELQGAIDKMRALPKPLLLHCKSGADRTGLMVTLYLHLEKGVPLAEARRALSWRYAHFELGGAGIVHEMLNAYGRAHAARGTGFEEWLASEYDREALTDAFEARPWWQRLAGAQST